MKQGLFAVVDTETTGLFPGGHDRIAEIAVVTLDRQGNVVDRWETLVNPQRDLGKQSIHRIRARDILKAPTFTEIAEELAWRLSGTIVAAHNLSFDARFLEAEFRRIGKPLPDYYLPRGLCTMRMSHLYLPGAGRSLQDCCDSFGIELANAHSAGDDAEAAAILLSRYMELDDDVDDWDHVLAKAAATGWVRDRPASTCTPALRSRDGAADDKHFLERVVVRLPEFSGPAEQEEYLALLDRALLDRSLSAHEETQLIETANALGIGRERAAELHLEYFEELLAAAWADGVLTEDETADLHRVAKLLGIEGPKIETAPPSPVASPGAGIRQMPAPAPIGPGDMIVLTGDMSRPRSQIEEELRHAGYVPHKAITKKVSLLVAADPDSLSGKARKARDYGITVVGEEFLWSTLLAAP